MIADSQCSDGKLRRVVEETVIPYTTNQKRGVKGLLRADKKFRTYGSEDQKREYHKRPHIEAVCSFLKTQYSAHTLTNVLQHIIRDKAARDFLHRARYLAEDLFRKFGKQAARE